MDLHASQMQGFFGVPVDNLYAEPVIAQYIKLNIPDYTNGVIVAKNPGATKRSVNPLFGIAVTRPSPRSAAHFGPSTGSRRWQTASKSTLR